MIAARAARMVRVLALGLVLAPPVGMVRAPEAAGTPSLTSLAGRWSGWGSIRMESGAWEQVKCVAVYQVKDGGGRLTQNLRCASRSYRIDAVADLDVIGAVVSGRWEERSYEAKGTVSGRLTDEGFSLSIQGDSFSAAMAVTVGGCRQSLTIVPRGFEIERIAVGLEKC